MKFNKLAILGHPIKHSLSPKIHNYWLGKLNIKGKYEAINTPVTDFEQTIKKLFKKKYVGSNLTIPLKEKSLSYLDKKDDIVRFVGAANVLIFSNKGKLEGRNTDVYGFEKSLSNLIKGKKKETAVILGSGGAARAVICVLIKKKFKNIILSNRTKKNSENIKKDFKKNFSSNKITNIICTNLKNISKYLKNTNLLINSTPLGMKGFPNLNKNIKDLDKKAVVFDLVYNPLKTKLIKDSEKLGLKNTNGLDMLIYQAQQAFYYWLKKKPAVTKELKNILENEIK